MGSVALVCMPWQALSVPSIQLGTLHAVLRGAGITCRSHSLHLKFMEFVGHGGTDQRARLSTADYQQIGDFMFMSAPGEWIFANPPLRQPSTREDKRYFLQLKQAGATSLMVKKLLALRARVPEFLVQCADEILAADPEVVGFTTTFGQTVASLALATELKQRRPELITVFGGANCEGSMGVALHRSYPCIDIVVRGEGEPVVAPLMRALLADEPTPDLPGLCLRRDGEQVVVALGTAPPLAMDDVPPPIYDEYFGRLGASPPLLREITPVLPYESSRGCWWGQKSQCTFCGLNGESMGFRSKAPDRVVSELLALADRYRVLDFTVVDNILDQGYFDSVLPRLREAGLDLELFYQTKANLSYAQLRLLRDAGVRRIRPGIESLSTPHLRLMRKGVTALQNIRLLKWCARLDLHVAWNLLYGLPGEDPAWFAAMAQLAPQLVHFDPPSISPLTLDRFSPYQADPARYGIEVLGPPPHYRNLYDLDDATRAELAWTFEFTLPDRPRPGDDAAPLIERILAWRQHASANRMALRYRCGPSFMVIEDDRSTFGRRRFTLDATEARVYLACEAGHDVGRIMRDLDAEHASGLSATAVRCLLEDFVAEGLAYEEGGRFLSLALPRRPERSARPVVALRNSAMGDTAMADGEHGASTPS